MEQDLRSLRARLPPRAVSPTFPIIQAIQTLQLVSQLVLLISIDLMIISILSMILDDYQSNITHLHFCQVFGVST